MLRRLSIPVLMLACLLTFAACGSDSPTSTSSGGDGLSAASAGNASTFCPNAVNWSDASAHVGSRTSVIGPVMGANYARTTRGAPTFIDVGAKYPSGSRFSVVVWGTERSLFPTPPESAYLGKTVCVTGQVQMYRGVAEIVVAGPANIAAR
nr:hypothetical protein [uncultured bacterium]